MELLIWKKKHEVPPTEEGSFLKPTSQILMFEIEDMENLLKKSNIEYEFYNLVSSTSAYHFSVWLAAIGQYNSQKACDNVKRMYEEYICNLLKNACTADNIEPNKYITHFKKHYEIALEEAIDSIQNGKFYDIEFTDKYLVSFLEEDDIPKIKSKVFFRISEKWIRLFMNSASKTIFED